MINRFVEDDALTAFIHGFSFPAMGFTNSCNWLLKRRDDSFDNSLPGWIQELSV